MVPLYFFFVGRHKNTEWARSHRHHHHHRHRCGPPTNSYVKYQLLKALTLPRCGMYTYLFFLGFLELVERARRGNKDVDARH